MKILGVQATKLQSLDRYIVLHQFTVIGVNSYSNVFYNIHKPTNKKMAKKKSINALAIN